MNTTVHVGDRLLVDGNAATVTKFSEGGHVQYDFDEPVGETLWVLHVWHSWVEAVASGEIETLADREARFTAANDLDEANHRIAVLETKLAAAIEELDEVRSAIEAHGIYSDG